ncbi:30S ribosomal protein S3 [Candidatus Uhrbacteria bacterium]|nr:30S ribosomal protein S3 [Candidatus Uhrbacteria bacterium]
MGNKVNPTIFRIGTVGNWRAKWFARKNDFPAWLREDIELRAFVWGMLKDAGVDRIDIERSRGTVTVVVHAAKPGFIIGRAGAGIEDLKKKIQQNFFRGRKVDLHLNIQEVSRPSLSSHVVMQSMIMDLEKRIPFRRILKQSLERVQKGGAEGVKVWVKGRLNGAEIARVETLSWGKVPLHNLRADIDYAQGFAKTIFGTIGVKVWINRGEVFEEKPKKQETPVL